MTAANKPRALIVHHSGLIGGAGRSLIDLCEGIAHEFDVTAMLPSNPPDLAQELLRLGIKHETFSVRMGKVPYYSGGENILHPRFWFYVMAIAVQWRFWRAEIRRRDPDVIIANSSVISWIGYVCGRHTSVLMVRETLRGRPGGVINRLLRRSRRRFDRVAYLSDHDRVRDGLVGAQTVIVRDAVHPRDYEDLTGAASAQSQLGLEPGYTHVLFMGGANRLKGMDVAVRALNFTASVDIRLIVAGRRPEQQRFFSTGRLFDSRVRFDRKILEEIRKHGLQSRVALLGTHTDVRPLLSACDFLVFPMNQPHQARPAFEIGFQRKPVVATKFDNISECVADDVNGLLFPRGDARALAHCFDRLAADAALRQRLGQSNFEHAMEYHQLDKVYRAFAADLLEILDHPPTSAAAQKENRG